MMQEIYMIINNCIDGIGVLSQSSLLIMIRVRIILVGIKMDQMMVASTTNHHVGSLHHYTCHLSLQLLHVQSLVCLIKYNQLHTKKNTSNTHQCPSAIILIYSTAPIHTTRFKSPIKIQPHHIPPSTTTAPTFKSQQQKSQRQP